MKTIPTLFLRDPDNRKRLLPQAHPTARGSWPARESTRKYDGTCVLLDDTGAWWAPAARYAPAAPARPATAP